MLVKIGLEYIKYKAKAKSKYGIHSPFVYDFVSNCLPKTINEDDKRIVDDLINSLENSHEEIEITDFGAGSKKLGSKRKVKDILANSSSKGKYGLLLYRLAKHYQPKNILELGTSLGIGSIFLKLGYPQTTLTTIEGCYETHRLATSHFKKLDLKVLALRNTFSEFIDRDETKTYDLIFIDGHHDGNALKAYLKLLDERITDDTIVVLDDIRWSPSMFAAWQDIKEMPEYHLTIDLFRVGLISRKPGQAKEHFTVRY